MNPSRMRTGVLSDQRHERENGGRIGYASPREPHHDRRYHIGGPEPTDGGIVRSQDVARTREVTEDELRQASFTETIRRNGSRAFYSEQ